VNVTEELLDDKSSDSGSRKLRLTAVGIRCIDHATHTLSAKVGNNFADKRRSLGGIVRLRTKATELSLVRHSSDLFKDFDGISLI
jgi:hypothetical protein